MKPLNIFSNAVRAKEILSIFVRHGFGSLIQRIETPSGWTAKFFPEQTNRRTLWQRIRDVCEDLGPTTVKFAQVLSARPDLIPAPLIYEFKKLRSSVRPVDWELIRPVIESELGGSMDDFFTDWKTKPVASGSLAQVYRAKLKDTGQEVAIKIQRPGIKKAIYSDLEILSWLAEKLSEAVEDLKHMDLLAIVQEIRTGITQELDFTLEARNAQYFNAINQEPEKVFAPEPIMKLTARKVVVYEWVNGEPSHQARFTVEEGKNLALLGGRSIFHQIVIAGFFHGDPHSGNILITPDKRICLVDWGLTGQLTRRMRYFLADIFAGAAAQNPEKIVRTISMMAEGTYRIDKTRLEKDIAIVLRRYPDFSTGNEAAGRFVVDLFYVLGQSGIHLSRDYALLGKAIISIEETAQHLDPEFDIRSIAKPFLEKLSWERHNPINITKQVSWAVRSSLMQLQALPTDLHRLLHRIEDGDLQVSLKLTGLDRIRSAVDRAAMHVVFGLVVAALIIGSSMIIATGAGPQVKGLSVFGMSGLALAGLITLAITWDAWRKG